MSAPTLAAMLDRPLHEHKVEELQAMLRPLSDEAKKRAVHQLLRAADRTLKETERGQEVVHHRLTEVCDALVEYGFLAANWHKGGEYRTLANVVRTTRRRLQGTVGTIREMATGPELGPRLESLLASPDMQSFRWWTVLRQSMEHGLSYAMVCAGANCELIRRLETKRKGVSNQKVVMTSDLDSTRKKNFSVVPPADVHGSMDKHGLAMDATGFLVERGQETALDVDDEEFDQVYDALMSPDALDEPEGARIVREVSRTNRRTSIISIRANALVVSLAENCACPGTVSQATRVTIEKLDASCGLGDLETLDDNEVRALCKRHAQMLLARGLGRAEDASNIEKALESIRGNEGGDLQGQDLAMGLVPFTTLTKLKLAASANPQMRQRFDDWKQSYLDWDSILRTDLPPGTLTHPGGDSHSPGRRPSGGHGGEDSQGRGAGRKRKLAGASSNGGATSNTEGRKTRIVLTRNGVRLDP